MTDYKKRKSKEKMQRILRARNYYFITYEMFSTGQQLRKDHIGFRGNVICPWGFQQDLMKYGKHTVEYLRII
jgi:hypothetical protein